MSEIQEEVKPKKKRNTMEGVKVALLFVIAACLVTMVVQNFNLTKSRDVYVRGGHIDVDNDVDVRVRNEVDVDISAINGQHDVFYNDYRGSTKYYRLPVNVRQ